MTFDLDPAELRAGTAAVADTGARVVAGAARPPTADLVPRWATSAALAGLADAARIRLSAAGTDVQAAARQIDAAVDDYQDADDRAARRLRDALWR
jgi:hypothetical protein